MPKRRKPRRDWLAWAVLFAGLILAVGVLSCEPTSPDAAPNLLGPFGDWFAGHLSSFLGLSVYILLLGWFHLVLLLLLRCQRWTWLRRLFGWLILLPWSTACIDTVERQLATSDSEPAGLGGKLGSFLHTSLDSMFDPLAPVLWPIVLIAFFLLGAYLAADGLVSKILGGSAGCLLGLVRFALSCAVAIAKRPFRRRSPAEPPAVAPDSSAIPVTHPETTPIADSADDQPAVPITRPMVPPAEEEPRYENFELPPLSLLEEPQPFPYESHDQKLRELAGLLEKTFKDFELNVRVVGINTGPVITQYEVSLETGLRLNKVTSLADDLALNLKVPSVRIVAPIPGKNTVGIEIPNEHRAVVRLKEVILTAGKKVARAKLPLYLGKDTEGKPLVYDLAEMPHLLIAGRTGTGKSVCMNAIILSLLMTRRPDEVKMIMIDPKMLELSEYGRIPHLMHPVVKDMKKAEAILAWAVDKMEERYDLLSRARVRGIAGYNELDKEEILRRVQPDEEESKRIPDKMPYIVIFVDEMNDLMMMMKREVEGHIIRLAQKSRAAGIHLVVATQKPTVDVITGLIKSNLPARICFQVSSRVDSRVVLDEMGAEKLLGKGDMLFLQPGTSTIMRSQGTYASDEEITRVVQHLECDEPCFAPELVQLKTSAEGGLDKMRSRDELYEQAVEIVVHEGRGSVSLLQRTLGIGYGRAARLIDFMAEDGIVGPYNGSNARDVLLTPDNWNAMHGGAVAAK